LLRGWIKEIYGEFRAVVGVGQGGVHEGLDSPGD